MNVASTVRGGAMRKGLTGDITLSETGMVYGRTSTSLAACSTNLVTTALEWTYQAGEQDVEAETLEKAATLLVLRRDTLRIIDGAGPSIEADQTSSIDIAQASRTETKQVSALPAGAAQSPVPPTEQADQAQSRKEGVISVTTSIKCAFSGMVVHIPLKRFQESGVMLVECPDCACTCALEPHGGVLRFKSHHKRKTTTPNTERRGAARGEMDWDVISS